MGERNKVTCSCGYETTLDLGAGLNACNFNYTNRLLEKPDAELFANAYNNDFINRFELLNEAYLCNDCKSIGTVYQLTYHLKSGQEVKVHGKCNSCNKVIETLPIDSIICPKCSKKMNLEIVGHWD